MFEFSPNSVKVQIAGDSGCALVDWPMEFFPSETQSTDGQYSQSRTEHNLGESERSRTEPTTVNH